MIHRLAIIIGSVAAAAVLALGFAATGFGPAAAPADAEQPPAAVALAVDGPAASPITRVDTTTVYVRPAAKPKVIHVTKRVAEPATKHTKTVRVHKVSKPRGDDEGEREGGEDEGDDD
jgi:hypothetical protein